MCRFGLSDRVARSCPLDVRGPAPDSSRGGALGGIANAGILSRRNHLDHAAVIYERGQRIRQQVTVDRFRNKAVGGYRAAAALLHLLAIVEHVERRTEG